MQPCQYLRNSCAHSRNISPAELLRILGSASSCHPQAVPCGAGIGALLHLPSVIPGKLQPCLFDRNLAKAVASEVAGPGFPVPGSIPTVCSGQSLSSPPSCLSPGAVVPCICLACVLGGIEQFLWLLCRHFFLLSSRNGGWEGTWEATSKGYRDRKSVV